MKEHLIEESILFISILKWVMIATGIGMLVGISTAVFLHILQWSSAYSAGHPYYFLMLPVGLAVSALAIHYLEPDATGYGIEKVIEAFHRRGGKINAAIVPVKLLATIVTIASGGSAGQVGPCGQIGASLASFMSGLFKFNEKDREKIVVCGLSAGFAAVLGAPFAGAIFGAEVLFVGSLLYEILLPSIIAGITSYHVALLLGIHYQFLPFHFTPVLTEAFILKIVLSGIFFGICSILVIEILRGGERLSDKLQIFLPFKGLIGGLILVGMTFMVSIQFLGSGFETIQAALRGEKIVFYAFLMKAIFTSTTLNFGGSGGLIMPILFIGATSGSLFGDLLGLDRATFASVGFVSLLAGTTNTPIAASILAVELFGSAIAPYAAIACMVSFLMTGHRSVFKTQVLSFKKSTSVHVEIGGELEHVRTAYSPREKSVIGFLLRAVKKIEDTIRKGGG